ncbi:hypothetical protein, partial [Desulforamulus putei]|uniref:hypothetical protein n=1 Tax=Desulforamulus putei TaxID=74701 RepID=UPI002FDDB2C9
MVSERIIWGEGDGSTLAVVDTPYVSRHYIKTDFPSKRKRPAVIGKRLDRLIWLLTGVLFTE